MTDYKEIFGYASIVVAAVGYIPYIKDILAHKTKPHAFSWFIWFSTESIAFAVQVVAQGGSGSWVHLVQLILCLLVFALALRYGHPDITRSDWIALSLGLLAILLWLFTKQPLSAVVCLIVIDIMAFAPTFRKSYQFPRQETAVLYTTSAASYALALFALEQYQIVNWLYQAVLVGLNIAFISWLFILRRRRTRIAL
ncbi:MAG: hypothetical protein HY565_00915 [Candidatus Kerfeldbacteria bacterium]|nr:hypothetical protein [Candidatus Kerfeldbacteria bacterium]